MLKKTLVLLKWNIGLTDYVIMGLGKTQPEAYDTTM